MSLPTSFLKRVILVLLGISLLIPSGLIYRHYQGDMTQAYQRVFTGGKVIDTACGPIQYSEFGSGAPMLIIHGAGGGYDQGLFFARLLGGGYRWIAPSRFGFLGTPVPQGANSSLQADAHAYLLDALGIDQVGVIGISGGGPSALEFAIRYPKRTTSLVMIDAVSHTMPARPAILSTMFNVFLNDFVFWSMVHISKTGLLAALGVPVEDQKSLPADQLAQIYAFLEDIMPMAARKNGQMLEQHMSEHDAGKIQIIQAPTLVVHTRNDTLVPYEQGEYSAQNIPGAQLISLEKGGHFGLLFSQEAHEKVLQFLGQYNP